jgi:hypothetical protein
MNDALQLPYTPDDVKKVLFSIIDMKEQETDGLHVVLFKICWTIYYYLCL